ncbi:unnamed protein product, partial [Prorocentrum cordatum]
GETEEEGVTALRLFGGHGGFWRPEQSSFGCKQPPSDRWRQPSPLGLHGAGRRHPSARRRCPARPPRASSDVAMTTSGDAVVAGMTQCSAGIRSQASSLCLLRCVCAFRNVHA